VKTVNNPGVNANEWKAAGKILLAARLLIEKRGWQQGANHPVPEECMATALEHAFQENRSSIVEFNYAREALARTLNIEREPQKTDNDPLDVPYWGRLLMDWNDAPGRKKEEVLEVLKRASELSFHLSKTRPGS
jgi:hypothetical protein